MALLYRRKSELKLLRIALLYLVFVVLTSSLYSQTSIELPPIVSPGGKKITAAVAPVDLVGAVKDGPKIAEELVDVLEGDLLFTGWFATVSNRSFIEEAHQKDKLSGKIIHAEWRTLGTQVLIKSSCRALEGGKLETVFTLIDTARGREILARRNTGDPKVLRQLAHRFSDAVYEHYSNRKGICSSRIAFVNRSVTKMPQQSELYVMDYDGHSVYRKTFDNSLVMSPSWSPDGKRLVFASLKSGFWDIYLLTLSSGKVQKLVSFPGMNTQASFSPDGRSLVLILSKTGNPEVFHFSLKDGKATRLTYTSAVENSPGFSPDGKHILYSSDSSGSPELYLLDLASKKRKAQRLTRLEGHNDNGAFSPDGTRIAFASSSPGKFNIFTMNADGSEKKRLTRGAGDKESPSWSADGEFICYSSNQLGPYNIYIKRADGGDLSPGEKVRRVSYMRGNNLMPVWSPYIR
jgi:TolB protein